jgi:hypothetical protein
MTRGGKGATTMTMVTVRLSAGLGGTGVKEGKTVENILWNGFSRMKR